MKRNVLLFTENFPPIEGGSGRWFWELYTRLDPRRVVILTHSEEHSQEIDSQIASPVIRLPLKSTQWGLKSWTGVRFYISSLLALKRIVNAHNIEEVHCGRVIHEGVTAWLLSLFTGLRYRCFIHGEDVETAATSREQALMVKQVCKHAVSLICNSENSKQLTQALGFDDGNKCSVLHPGANVNYFTPKQPDIEFREKMGWQHRFIILTVGRLQQRKGQDYFIQALPDVIQHFPNCLYVVVGDGDFKANLLELVERLSLHEYVQFLSGLDDKTLVSCYQQCDKFILPNRTIDNDIEGFGMVLVEAQACGKHVIAGRSGGTSETMKVGETGDIIDCSTVESLIRDVVPVLKKPNHHPSVYREHVVNNFTWEGHVAKFTRLINKA